MSGALALVERRRCPLVLLVRSAGCPGAEHSGRRRHPRRLRNNTAPRASRALGRERVESADVILKGLLNGTDTREGSSPQDEDTNVYVEITKGLNSSKINQITDLTDQILTAMSGNNNGASDDADDTHEISLLSEIRTIYDENEALNKTEANFRNRSRPVTPIYARASGFGAYV